MSYWNGDEWRWGLRSHGPSSISVIEPAEAKEAPKTVQTVPFGFSRVLAPLPVDPEPLVWEGED